MSDTIVKALPYRVDMAEPVKKTYLDTLFATQDNEAHRFDISLCRDKTALEMPSGAAVSAYFIRYSDNATIILNGDMSGNVASVTLKKSCYNKSGQFALIIKVTAGGVISTVFYGEGTIFASSTDTILDEENMIPSLSDLLAQIATMEAATNDAKEATDAANAAAEHAPYVDATTNHWMAWDTDSGKYIDTGANATGAKGDPGNTPYIGANGNWWIGETDTGTKAQGPAGANGTGSGTVTAVTVSGTKYEPDQTGNIDLGELGGGGDGTVTSVNGVSPDEAGNVQIGALTSDPNEDSGETPEMGSVPINADQLGGVAASKYALKTDTAPDSKKLNGKTASEFLGVNDTAQDSEKLNGQPSGAYAFFAGDVFDNTSEHPILLNGHVTSDAKNIHVVIPFCKPIVADKLTFKTFQAEMRGTIGYINNTSGYQNILSLCTVSPHLYDSYVTVTITKSDSFGNVTNNTPVTLAARMRIEFS